MRIYEILEICAEFVQFALTVWRGLFSLRVMDKACIATRFPLARVPRLSKRHPKFPKSYTNLLGGIA